MSRTSHKRDVSRTSNLAHWTQALVFLIGRLWVRVPALCPFKSKTFKNQIGCKTLWNARKKEPRALTAKRRCLLQCLAVAVVAECASYSTMNIGAT